MCSSDLAALRRILLRARESPQHQVDFVLVSAVHPKVSPTQERFASCLLAVNIPLKRQLLRSPCNFIFFLQQHALTRQQRFDISIQMDGNFGKRPFRFALSPAVFDQTLFDVLSQFRMHAR